MRKVLMFAVIFSSFLVIPPALAVDYDYQEITNRDFPPSVAHAINDNQQVVGHYDDGLFTWKPFEGTTVVGNFGYTAARGSDINNLGHIIGNVTNPDFSTTAFFWDQTNPIQKFNQSGATGTEAQFINNHDHFTGIIRHDDYAACTSATPCYEMFLKDDSGFTNYGSPGLLVEPKGINDSDIIVGTYIKSPGESKPFVFTVASGFQDLELLGGPTETVYGINNLNQVVGASEGEVVVWDSINGLTKTGIDAIAVEFYVGPRINDKGQILGVYENGELYLYDLEAGFLPINIDLVNSQYPTPSNFAGITDFNNNGDFTGWGWSRTSGSSPYSVVATVTPEPASMALFGLGAGALALAKRRKKLKKLDQKGDVS